MGNFDVETRCICCIYLISLQGLELICGTLPESAGLHRSGRSFCVMLAKPGPQTAMGEIPRSAQSQRNSNVSCVDNGESRHADALRTEAGPR